jgi:hypothetical protein
MITRMAIRGVGRGIGIFLVLSMTLSTAFAQELPPQSADSSAPATEAPAGQSLVRFIPNPHPFGVRGRPHILPMRSPEFFRNAPPAPASAHLTYYGGRVVSSLQVVQVVWGAGSYLPQVTSTSTPSIASFYQDVLNSSYVDWLTEYDTVGLSTPTSNQAIGRGGFINQYVITPSTKSTTVDDSTVQTEIAAQIAAGHLPAPTTDGNGNTNTYYAIFFPNGTTITQDGSSSCVAGGFCAYHGTVAPSGTLREFFYGVHPDMQAGSGCDTGCGNGSPFGNYTSVASHEMTETITDAEVGIAPNLAPPLAWYDVNNGEIGDICNAQQGTVTAADGVTYTVQAEWSNAQGACVVRGTSAGPAFTLTPSSLPFSSQYVYETSTAHVATVANTGGVALPMPTVTITGTDHALFSKSTTCTGAIALGKSCTISVKFKPVSTGSKTATLNVSVAGTVAKTVALTGVGVAAPYSLSPRSMAFGNCMHATTCKAPTVITVKNNGAAAVPIGSLALTGASHALFSKTTTCGTSIAVGKSCTISVSFSPTAAGAATASLNVNAGGGDGSQSVALSGKGT